MMRPTSHGISAIFLTATISVSSVSADPPTDPTLLPEYCASLKSILDDPWAEFARRKSAAVTDCVAQSGEVERARCTQSAEETFSARALDQMTKTVEEEWKRLACKSKI